MNRYTAPTPPPPPTEQYRPQKPSDTSSLSSSANVSIYDNVAYDSFAYDEADDETDELGEDEDDFLEEMTAVHGEMEAAYADLIIARGYIAGESAIPDETNPLPDAVRQFRGELAPVVEHDDLSNVIATVRRKALRMAAADTATARAKANQDAKTAQSKVCSSSRGSG